MMPKIVAHALMIAALCLPALACAPATERQEASPRTDALNAALTARTATVGKKLAAAQESGAVTPAEAARLQERLTWVETDSARYVQEQGFLSAGESASYNRALDEIEASLE